jgi:hypothetical protein
VGFFTMEGASRVCFSHSIFGFFSPAVVEGHLVRRNGSPMFLCLWLVGVFCGVCSAVGLVLLLLLLLLLLFSSTHACCIGFHLVFHN